MGGVRSLIHYWLEGEQQRCWPCSGSGAADHAAAAAGAWRQPWQLRGRELAGEQRREHRLRGAMVSGVDSCGDGSAAPRQISF